MSETVRPITGYFKGHKGCSTCRGCGHVCENHPDLAWGEMISDENDPKPGACYCGGAGMPCPQCNPDAYEAPFR
jgi:hypothetical protein